jgi:hypothetical protein
MPPDQIGHMSLNGLKRRVATHDKTQTKTQMGNHQLHWIQSTGFQLGGGGGGPPLVIPSTKKPFVGVSLDTRVLVNEA